VVAAVAVAGLAHGMAAPLFAEDCARPRRVEGTVRAGRDFSPIERARVWPVGAPDEVVVTGESGAFLLTTCSGSSEGFRVAAEGCLTATRDWPAAGDTAGGELVVALGAAFTLTGTVEDWRGRPVEGAEVRVELADKQWSLYLDPRFQSAPTRSDAAGRFTIAGLDPRPEQVAVVTHPLFPPVAVAIDGPPGRSSSNPAPSFSLRVTLSRPGALEGEVIGPGGAPIGGARVALASARLNDGSRVDPLLPGSASFGTRSDADGRFRFVGLPSGPAVLAIEAPGYATRLLPAVEVPMVGLPEEPLDLGAVPLVREALIEGWVTDPDGAPVPGAEVTLYRPVGRLRHRVSHYVVAPRTDDTGWFRADGLEPGATFDLQVEAEGFSVWGRRGLVARSGAPLDVSLEPAAGAVAGSVERTSDAAMREPVPLTGVEVSGRVVRATGEPVAGDPVHLRPEPPTEAGWSKHGTAARTDEEGAFRIVGVGDGTFRVVVFGPPQGFTGQSPWRYELPGLLTVRGAAITGLEIRLPPTAAAHGRILGLSAEELDDVSVGVSQVGEILSGTSVEPHPDGTFEIPDLLPGSWSVGAWLPDGRSASESVEVELGVTEVWVDLAFGGVP